MDTKVNYAVVGLFVILLSAAMTVGFVWLSGFGNHKTYNTYLVYARGGVTGLNTDSPVLFNGVRVGSVNKIELDSLNPQFVKLYLKIDTDIPITESTVATLIPQGITGLVYVGLKAQSAEAPILKVEKDQIYPVIPYEKPLLTQISEVLPDLAKNMGEISEKFKKVFNDQNIDNINATLNNLKDVTEVLDKKSGSISNSITSLNTVLKNSAAASQYFEGTLVQAQQTANQLNKVSATINLQMLPNVQDLLNRMNETTTNLQEMSDELKTNPSILIRGKQPPPPGPGE